jgi:hypothetical protein
MLQEMNLSNAEKREKLTNDLYALNERIETLADRIDAAGSDDGGWKVLLGEGNPDSANLRALQAELAGLQVKRDDFRRAIEELALRDLKAEREARRRMIAELAEQHKLAVRELCETGVAFLKRNREEVDIRERVREIELAGTGSLRAMCVPPSTLEHWIRSVVNDAIRSGFLTGKEDFLRGYK